MRLVMIMTAATLVVIGCSQNSPSSTPHPGVQINDSLMYISANPITSTPVTFWHELSQPRRNVLREELTWRYGPSNITLLQEDGAPPIVLSEVEVSSARLTRKVSVMQGDSVLYAREQDVTFENLESLASCTIVSTEWEEVRLTAKDITFSVDYWRYYETKYGRGGYSIVSDMVMIPVRMQ